MRTLQPHARAHRRCCRSTRSTCCSARTTCRCSPGWAPTTPTCCTAPPRRRPRRIVEYWAHVAAFMPVELWPHMRHRMRGYRERGARLDRAAAAPRAGRLAAGRGRRAGRVDARATSTTGCRASKEHWGWNWSETKKALEYLFAAGELAVAGRNQQFERLYDLPERVIPPEHLDAPEPTVEEAARRAACAGRRSRTASAPSACLRDYFRMRVRADQAGARAPWSRRASCCRCASRAGTGRPTCTATPRCRAGSTPARCCQPVRPAWCGSATAPSTCSTSTTASRSTSPSPSGCTATTCCRSCSATGSSAGSTSRPTGAAGTLLVLASYAEPDAPEETAAELAAELRELAGWLGLDDIVVAAPRRPGRRAHGGGQGALTRHSGPSAARAASRCRRSASLPQRSIGHVVRRGGGLPTSARPGQQRGPGRREPVRPGQPRVEVLQQRQPGRRPLRLGDGHRPVEPDDRPSRSAPPARRSVPAIRSHRVSAAVGRGRVLGGDHRLQA